MPADIAFDQAQFQSHLDDIFRDRIIDETYPPPPTARSETPLLPRPASVGDRAAGILPALTIVRPQTDIALADESAGVRAARDHATQKELLAHPQELRRLFPEMLRTFDSNHHGYLDLQDIESGLGRASLTDLQRNYLTVLKNGYSGILRDSSKFVPGIQEYDLARLEKAMNRGLPEDPIWARQSRVDLPATILFGAIVSAAPSLNLVMKHPVTFGAVYLGFLALGEAGLLYNHLSGRNDGAYDDIERKYRAFVNAY